MAEQAADPSNTRVVRNRLSGCMPSVLRGQLDLNASDLGGLPFCDEMRAPTGEVNDTAKISPGPTAAPTGTSQGSVTARWSQPSAGNIHTGVITNGWSPTAY